MRTRLGIATMLAFVASVCLAGNRLIDVEPPDPNADYATRAYCGVAIQDVADLYESLQEEPEKSRLLDVVKSLRPRRGVIIANVIPDSAAELAGAQSLDVIATVNKRPIATVSDFQQAVATVQPPEKLLVRYRRLVVLNPRPNWRTFEGSLPTTSYLTHLTLAIDFDHDPVEDVCIATCGSLPDDRFNSYVTLQAVQVRDNPAKLRIVFNATSSNTWFFLRKAKLATGDNTLDFQLDRVVRDNGHDGSKHWLREKGYATIDDDQVPLIREMLATRSVKVLGRLDGDEYRRDIRISSDERDQMQLVFDRWAINEGRPITMQFVPKLEPMEEEIESEPDFRTFTDKTGEFSVEAVLIAISGNVVHLKKADGETIKVPLHLLSEDNQDWIESQ